MLKPTFVSIAIPFYKSKNYLDDSIQSVLNQTFQNWELILIDDGGNDGSLNIAHKYAAKDQRIRVYCDGKNKGLAARLNESIQVSSGNYYIRMDADDVMDCTRIEKQIDYLERHPNIDVIGSSAIIIGDKNEILYGVKDSIAAPKTKKDVESGIIFIHPSVAGRTTWFKEHPYDEKLKRSQDYFLWLSSVESSNFDIINEPLLFYRVIDEDIWGKFKRDNRTMFNYYYGQLSENNFWNPLCQCLKQELRLPLFWLYFKMKGSKKVIERRYKKLSFEEKEEFEKRLLLSIKRN